MWGRWSIDGLSRSDDDDARHWQPKAHGSAIRQGVVHDRGIGGAGRRSGRHGKQIAPAARAVLTALEIALVMFQT